MFYANPDRPMHGLPRALKVKESFMRVLPDG